MNDSYGIFKTNRLKFNKLEKIVCLKISRLFLKAKTKNKHKSVN